MLRQDDDGVAELTGSDLLAGGNVPRKLEGSHLSRPKSMYNDSTARKSALERVSLACEFLLVFGGRK